MRVYTPIVCSLLLVFQGTVMVQVAQPADTPAQRDARMQWWREARFGMFVHWGLYAIPAGEWDGQTWNKGGMEWIQRRANVPADVYEKRLTPLFKPKRGFAKEWAELAKQAGCKYVVFTNKHHDGFALHDSSMTTFDAKDVTGRDLHKEIMEAIRAERLHVGVYHSLWDWHHPHAYAGPGTNNPPCQTMEGRDPNIYLDYLRKQVEEVVSHYGPVDIMWFDYSSPEIQGESWRANELLAMVRRHNPNVIVNNRLYRSVEAGWPKDWSQGFAIDSKYGDFSTPEQHIPPTGVPGVDWETCMTMNGTWGYSKHHHDWKSSETLIRQLVDTASKGGNYLLNIGPMADGTVPPQAVACMRDIGRWMKVNGESIYATTASPFAKLPWGRCTKRIDGQDITLYLHVFDWPTDGRLVVPGLNNLLEDVYVLADHKPLSASVRQDDIVLHVPEKPADPVDTVIVVKLFGSLNVAAPPIVQAQDGTILLPAAQATVHGSGARYESGGAKDNIGFWNNPGDWVEWKMDIRSPGKFTVVASIASPKEGARFQVNAGSSQLECQVTATGSYSVFKGALLGNVSITERGEQRLTVRPVREGWSAMNLKSVTLKPVTPSP